MSVYWGPYTVFGFVNFLLDLLHRLHRPHNLLLYQIVASTVVPLSLTTSLSLLLPFDGASPRKFNQKTTSVNKWITWPTRVPHPLFNFQVFSFQLKRSNESPRLLCSSALTVMCPLRFVFVVVSELKIAAGVVLYYPRLKPPTTVSALGSGLRELVLSPAWKNSRSAIREVFARILRPKSMLRLNYFAHRADLLIPTLFGDLSAVFNTLPETGIMSILQECEVDGK